MRELTFKKEDIMKKFINYVKGDYNNVKWCLQNTKKIHWSDKAVFIYYWTFVIVFLPLIIPVFIVGRIWIWNIRRKIKKLENM